MSSAAPFQALCGPPWMSSSSGCGPGASGSRTSQPCDDRAVGDRELARLAREELDLGDPAPCVGQYGRPRRVPRSTTRSRRTTSGVASTTAAVRRRPRPADDACPRRRRADAARRPPAGRRRGGCSPGRGCRTRRSARRRPAAVARPGSRDRRASRCGRATRRGRRGSPPSSGTREARAWPTGSPGPADDEERRRRRGVQETVRSRPPSANATTRGSLDRRRLDDVNRRARKTRSRSGAVAAAKASRVAVRRPGRLAGVPVAVGHLAARRRSRPRHVQVQAHAAQDRLRRRPGSRGARPRSGP